MMRTETIENPKSAAPEPAGASTELALRLREQTAENAKLDTELRYLQAELAVRQEYITTLENELETIHAHVGGRDHLAAEFQAYRERFSHRVADRLASIVHHRSWLYRPLKLLSRAVTAVVSRPPTLGGHDQH